MFLAREGVKYYPYALGEFYELENLSQTMVLFLDIEPNEIIQFLYNNFELA